MSADTNSHRTSMSLHGVTVESDGRLALGNATFSVYAGI